MTLSAKQEAFALAYLETGNASEAYRRTYNASKMQPGTVNREATRLLANPLITTRIAELQAAAAKEAVVDRSYVLRNLVRVLTMAIGDAPVRRSATKGEDGKAEVTEYMVDLKAANRALELIGKSDEVRLFVDRHEHSANNGEPLLPADVEPRALARAVLDIIRQANISDAPTGVATSSDDRVAAPAAPSRSVSSTGRRPGAGSSPAPVPAPRPAGKRSPPATIAHSHHGTFAPGAPIEPRAYRTGLEPGERQVLDNGAWIEFDAELQRYAVFDPSGRGCGFRREIAAAIDLGMSKKPMERK